MSYTKHDFEVFAVDFHSPFIRNYIWVKNCYNDPTIFNFPRPVIGIAARNNHIQYFYEHATWQAAHEAAKKRARQNPTFVEALIERAEQMGIELNAWSQRAIQDANLSSTSGEALMTIVRAFVDRQALLYTYGVVLPMLDFGEHGFVEHRVKAILQKCASGDAFVAAFDLFTQPERNSFAQDQEERLLEFISQYWGNTGWRKHVLEQSWNELQRLEPEFAAKLQEHARNYGWVYYVYMGPAYGPEQFLEFIRDALRENIDPMRKITELKSEMAQRENAKKDFYQEHRVSAEDQTLLALAGKMVWAKPRRKDRQSLSYYHLEKLQREMARRLNISLAQVRSAPIEELHRGLVEGKEINIDVLNSINRFHVCFPNDDGTITIEHGQEGERLFATHVRPAPSQTIAKGVTEIQGQCAYPGRAVGIVCRVDEPSDMVRMKQGDILVSQATTPSIMLAIKKAAAIVTDEGGLTCHASIVSRELKTPCIVGTKIATNVFKDGDRVEVDATKGIVRKL